MRGTGKSSIGQALADIMGYTFIDTDVAIEEEAGCRVAEIVSQYGWEHFRSLERDIVVRVARQDRQVVATGGGAFVDRGNAASLKKNGVVVLLVCDTPTLQRRIEAGTNRPSLTGQGSAVEELEQVWQSRYASYCAAADLTYDVSAETLNSTLDVQRKADAIYSLLQRKFDFRHKD
jgi:shikimate kinase